MLYHPDWNGKFELHTDASKMGCGSMLAQQVDGQLRPVNYASHSFNPHQEPFAVKRSPEQFRSYVLAIRIKVVTGHVNLQWLTSISPKQSNLARWDMPMAEFDFIIEHHAVSHHVVPDTLSRAPLSVLRMRMKLLFYHQLRYPPF